MVESTSYRSPEIEQDRMQQTLALPGTVFALGSEAEAAARLYALLTGRPCRICKTATDVAASLNDVVICITSELSPHLMYQLYVREQSSGLPGLIFAGTPALLESVCKSQAAKLLRSGRPNPRRIFLHTKLNFAARTRGTDSFVSGQEPAETLYPLLSAGAAILSIFGHSDGISLDISHAKVLCPFIDLPPDPDRGLWPSCQVMERCTKFPMMPRVREAKSAGWILPLKLLRATIGVIGTCAAVRLRDGVVDPAYGLAAALLHQADFGAIVTTWRKEPSSADGGHLNGLINDLSAGVNVGVATAALNRSPFCERFGARYCIVGDPCFALAGDGDYPQLPVMTKPAITALPEPSAGETKETSRARLVRDAILHSLHSNPAYDLSKGEKLALELAEYAQTGAAAGPPDDALSPIDHRLLEFLSGFPWLPGFFQHLGWIEGITENVPCPACSAPSRISHLIFPRHARQRRDLTSCSSCGDVRDMPVNWEIALDLTKVKLGSFSLSGIPSGTQLLVCIVRFWGTLFCAFAGNPSLDGNFSFQVPSDLPPEPMFCRVLFARSLEVGAISFKLRQMPDGTYESTAAYNAMPNHAKNTNGTGR